MTSQQIIRLVIAVLVGAGSVLGVQEVSHPTPACPPVIVPTVQVPPPAAPPPAE
jgi:hypothetical protein